MNKLLAFIFTICSFQLMCTDISWSSPPDLLSTLNVNASNPQVAMDANGNVVAVWIENESVKSKSKPIGMSWGSEATLSNSNSTLPHLVCDSNGNATAVWVENGIIK